MKHCSVRDMNKGMACSDGPTAAITLRCSSPQLGAMRYCSSLLVLQPYCLDSLPVNSFPDTASSYFRKKTRKQNCVLLAHQISRLTKSAASWLLAFSFTIFRSILDFSLGTWWPNQSLKEGTFFWTTTIFSKWMLTMFHVCWTYS